MKPIRIQMTRMPLVLNIADVDPVYLKETRGEKEYYTAVIQAEIIKTWSYSSDRSVDTPDKRRGTRYIELPATCVRSFLRQCNDLLGKDITMETAPVMGFTGIVLRQGEPNGRTVPLVEEELELSGRCEIIELDDPRGHFDNLIDKAWSDAYDEKYSQTMV